MELRMESHLAALTAFFSLHPHGALFAIFGAALLESLAVIGTVIPGSSIVFVGGALVGLGALEPWPTAAAAVAGAIVGDGLSYWFGHHYRDRIGGIWPFHKFPRMLQQGQQYFAGHGGKSIFFGRFLSPVRAIVPVIAGMSRMPPLRFLLINILSALVWAAAHLVPGFVFGASLQLAGAVSARLLVLLLLLAGVLWGLAWGVRLSFRYGWPLVLSLRDRLLLHVQQRRGSGARIVRLLLDPASANGPALLLAMLLVLAGFWAFFSVLEDVLMQDPLVQLDQSLYAALQALRTEWGDTLMVVATTLGAATVIIPVIVAVALYFVWQRAWRTLGYWLTAAVVAELSVMAIKMILTRARPNNPLYVGLEQFSFPSGHTTMSVVVYGFLAFLLARGKPAAVRATYALIAACLVTLIAFSRLYLGVHWFSDVLASMSLGLAWVALLGIAYLCGMHHQTRPPVHGMPLALIVLATMAGAANWHITHYHSVEMARYDQPPAVQTVLANWQTEGWRTLPAARAELDGEPEEPFSLQAAAPLPLLAAALASAGWQAPPPWSMQAALLWLLPDTPLPQLPVLPKFDHGASAKATFVKQLNPQERLVLRLWPSRYAVQGEAGAPLHRLWHGTATVERLHHPAGLVSLIRTTGDFETGPDQLERDMEGGARALVPKMARRGKVLLLW
jgi:membrane protein DedA with SNARE-associated domain/membrane-associated phospholipid phosphatase